MFVVSRSPIGYVVHDCARCGGVVAYPIANNVSNGQMATPLTRDEASPHYEEAKNQAGVAEASKSRSEASGR